MEPAERLNEFFASAFITEDLGQIAVPELIFAGKESEELSIEWLYFKNFCPAFPMPRQMAKMAYMGRLV